MPERRCPNLSPSSARSLPPSGPRHEDGAPARPRPCPLPRPGTPGQPRAPREPAPGSGVRSQRLRGCGAPGSSCNSPRSGGPPHRAAQSYLGDYGDDARLLILGQGLATGQGYAWVNTRTFRPTIATPGYPALVTLAMVVSGTGASAAQAIVPAKLLTMVTSPAPARSSGPGPAPASAPPGRRGRWPSLCSIRLCCASPGR